MFANFFRSGIRPRAWSRVNAESRRIPWSRLAARLALGISLLLAAAGIYAAAQPPREIDGLVRVSDSRIDHLYVLPGADFSRYNKVRLDPVDVSFSERWAPNTGARGIGRLSDRDIEDIRSTVASEFEKTVADELTKGGYQLVTENGPDVLRITPMIVNLYVTAPSRPMVGRVRTFVANTGHMTLVAAASDSVSGEVLARVVDTQRGRRTGRLQLANSVTNMADARRAFTLWATVLRSGLDEAKTSPVANSPEREAAETNKEVHR